MNQDHLQQQPAADKYVIGGPSEFAEDLSNEGPGWKADLGSDGNTKRNEIGQPEFRADTFNKSDKAPGVSPSRQASVEEVHARAEVATKVARLMLPKSASEQIIEDQALSLMDLPLSNLKNTLARLAQEQEDADDDEEDEDEGQQKQASDDDEEDEDEGQQKEAALPPEFLEQQQKMKDKAKDKDEKKDDKKDDKEGKKEASRRKAQQQQADDDEDEGQQKQARRVKAQGQDEKKQGQQEKDEKQAQGQQDKGQEKEARGRKAQQQQDDGEDEGQQKQAQQQQDAEDEGQQKEAADQDEKKEGQEEEKQVGKEAYALIKQAAVDLLQIPQASRGATFKVVLPALTKAAALGLQQMGQQQQVSMDQLQAQVQQLVQQAMQQQQGQQQQQPAMADDALVDQMLQEPGQLSEEGIQMDAPDMDLGLYAGEEDPALQAIFASDTEVQRALEAQAIERGHSPTAQTRTASTRTVGTRPSAGVRELGGGTSGASSTTDEINRLSGMWSTAPDVSSVFSS